ncbi:DEAD/DEAH box helicase family protein [Longispora sp. K20-0274]|uniref:DEAD/DEAH box helicase family protein n=1 Tax=Longispora sp. K20-0274 TaxID=3088255 RepID=UPI00399A2BB9
MRERDPRRSFTQNDRAALWNSTNGKCAICGDDLGEDWEPDHIDPWSAGGRTLLVNGQPTCKPCNRKKGKMTSGTKASTVFTPVQMQAASNALRAWQKRLLSTYDASTRQAFTIVACPGAGKTRGAVFLAVRLLNAGVINQIIVVCPSITLRYQWSNAFNEFNVRIDPEPSNGSSYLYNARNYPHGYAVTYATIGRVTNGGRHKTACENDRTMVIFDEVHHSAEGKSWGDGVFEAFKSASRVLCLSGTPYRTDNNKIAFVEYDNVGNGIFQARADLVYGYSQALGDKPAPVRRSKFLHYDSELRWQEVGPDDLALFQMADRATFLSDIKKQDESKAFKAVLRADSDWARGLLDRGVDELAVARDDDRPDDPRSGGLVLCSDQKQARAIAQYLQTKSKTRVTLVISDEKDSDERIKTFRKNDDEWIVAVRKVSEGVDIPRLRVLVYLTNVRTKMFFEQGIGRVVRKINKEDERPAIVILPALPVLMALTAGIEQEQIDTVTQIIDDEPADGTESSGSGGGGQGDDTPDAIAGSPFLHSIIFGGEALSPERAATALAEKLGLADGDLPAIQRLLSAAQANPAVLNEIGISPAVLVPAQPTKAAHEQIAVPDFADLEGVIRTETQNMISEIFRLENNGRTGTNKDYAMLQARVNRQAGVESRAKGKTQRTEAELLRVHREARRECVRLRSKRSWPER